MKPSLVWLWILLISSCASIGFSAEFEPLQRSVTLMGTTLRITQYDPDRNRAIMHSEEWIRIVEKAEQQWSNWRGTSEVSQLNNQPPNVPFHLSSNLCEIIPTLQSFNTQTGGKFDPGIGQLLKIWGYYGTPRVPSNKEIQTALEVSGIQKIEIDKKRCIAVRTASVLLDSGAFGKGLALEQILNHAKAHNSGPFLADFGGQIVVYGKPENELWEAELAHPEKRDQGSGIRVRFRSGSLSTSGGSERDRSVGKKRVGHILDPITGEPVVSNNAVTVWHESPLFADILSTALYVMSADEGLVWANQRKLAACYLSSEKGAVATRKSLSFNDLIK